MTSPPPFLSSALQNINTPGKLHVTLTFAQSLDAKIAGEKGKQLILSGKESMVMTHWMRTMHDAILVGSNTALNDDPQLNTRLLPPLSPGEHRNVPRPVILDSKLRLSPDCKLLRNYKAGTGRRPWVIASQGSFDPVKRSTLIEAGARVLVVDASSDSGLLPINKVLSALSEAGVQSLMVEGGARVINTFLRAGVVHSLIITVAPTIVGSSGIGYDADASQNFELVSTQLVGKDTVVVMNASS